MTPPQHATLIVNTAARGVPADFDGSRIVRYLAKRGIGARLVFPGSGDEATSTARDSAAANDRFLFVVGGDGSMREAARGLAGSETALAALPMGTVNVWAREAGIPRSLRAALDCHLEGQSVHMDLGRAGGDCFLLMAGIGWDAQIAAAVSPTLKRRIGDLAYMVEAARALPGLRPVAADWTADGERTTAPLAWMVLSNTRLYGGKVRLTPDATISDGLLDLVAFCPETVVDGARLAAKILARSHHDRHMLEGRFARVEVETPGLAVQLDGDCVGSTPMSFSVEPGGLVVSVPKGPLPAIFGS